MNNVLLLFMIVWKHYWRLTALPNMFERHSNNPSPATDNICVLLAQYIYILFQVCMKPSPHRHESLRNPTKPCPDNRLSGSAGGHCWSALEMPRQSLYSSGISGLRQFLNLFQFGIRTGGERKSSKICSGTEYKAETINIISSETPSLSFRFPIQATTELLLQASYRQPQHYSPIFQAWYSFWIGYG